MNWLRGDFVQRASGWARLNVATIVAGCLIVTCWTLLRFLTKSINFDLAGQQLLARQWLDGSLGGSVMAPTNYIIKMIFLYMPAEIVGVNPKIFLITSTILVNVATFVGIYLLLKKIVQYFSIPIGLVFNLLMLWLATIIGSVLWIQFTNSRNLEIVAGLGILYLGLMLNKKPIIIRTAGLIVLSAITFFADPMQLFITATILIVYSICNCLFINKNKRQVKITVLIASAILMGYIISELLVMIVKNMAHVEFFGVYSLSQSFAIFQQPGQVVFETIKNFLRLIAGTNEMGAWRQVLNVSFVIMMSVVFIKFVMHKKLSKNFMIFIGVALFAPLVVYIASGQSILSTDTSRYLVMLTPAIMICFSALELQKGMLRKIIESIIVVVLLINITSLVYVTIKYQRADLIGESAYRNRYEYMLTNNYHYGYSSMDTAIAGGYLFGNGKRTLLPLVCEKNRLRKSTLFFDKSVFLNNESALVENVPIILDGDAIIGNKTICTADSITAQIGIPLLADKTLGGDGVLIYESSALRKILF